MANELKIRNGLLVVGNEQVTGSLTVSQGITSSLGLFGTASWATNTLTAVSASFASTVVTASFATNAGLASTASFALAVVTASFAVNAGTAATASWAASSPATTLNTGSTYQITSSWANNVVSASYSLSSSYSVSSSIAATASFAASVSSASFSTNSATASTISGFTFDNTSSTSIVTASNNVVVSRITGSYLSVDYQYVINSGSNLRVGNIFGGWLPSGSVVTYAEYVTTDIGTTDQVSMSIALTGSFVQLLSNAATSFSWSIRALATYL